MLKKFVRLISGKCYYGFMGEEDGGSNLDDVINDNQDDPSQKGKSGVTEPDNDDQLDDDGWIQKRGAKNVRSELARKNEELKKMKDELDTFKKQPVKKQDDDTITKQELKAKKYPDHIEKYKDYAIKKGVDPEFIEMTCDTMLQTAIEASQFHAKKQFDDLSDMRQEFLERKIDKIVSNLKSDKASKAIVVPYEKEVIEELKKIDPKFWGDTTVIDAAIGLVAKRHFGDLGIGVDSDDAIIPKRSVSESQNIPSSKTGIGVSQDEIEEAASVGSFDLSDPNERKLAITLAKRRKMRDEAKNNEE